LATINQNHTKVQLYDCWGGANQKWMINPDGTIVNVQSGRCLDAELASINSNHTVVQLYDCWGGDNQKWDWPAFNSNPRMEGGDNRNRQGHRCLDAELATINQNHTVIQLFDCWGGQNQYWTNPVPEIPR
jgi:hypothetical protein